MNDRGQYGASSNGRVHVGASLLHRLELKQRYDNAKTAAVQALLNDLARDGVASSVGTNRWEIALKDGAWVDFTWYPDYSALEVTITDRELRRVDQVESIRRRYEAILSKITPRLQSFGVTTVGAAIYADPTEGTYVGQGSILGHTPGEVEDELDQLAGELNCFGQEIRELMKPAEGQAKTAVQAIRDEELAAHAAVESFQPQVNEVYRIEKLLNEGGVSKSTTQRWRNESIPPYADILMASIGTKNEALKQRFIAAIAALDKVMPMAQRHAAVKRSRELSDRRSELEYKAQGESPLVQWKRSVWDPFIAGWTKFYREKKDIPLQTWPLSGTWDRIQEYRQQWIDLRKNAPFKSKCPDPLDPSSRKDPSLTDIFGSAGKILKWGIIGALGIGAVVALSSVASNLRTGKDPGEKYMELIRSRRPRASSALPKRKQLALPSGEPEET